MVASDRAHITLFVKLFDTLALQVIRLAARPRAGVGRGGGGNHTAGHDHHCRVHWQ